MFNKILVALDLSDLRQAIFDSALTLAKATGAHLTLLHVLAPEDEMRLRTDYQLGRVSSSVYKLYQDLWKEYEEKGLTMLKLYAEAATAAGVPTDFTQQDGDSPSRVICDLARNLDIDLIMIGRRGYSGLNEMVLGSVSNYVLHHAPCSIYVVHQPTKPSSLSESEKQVSISA